MLAIATGLLVFVLTASWMRHASPPEVTWLEVTGGDTTPGATPIVRVVARTQGRQAGPVTLAPRNHARPLGGDVFEVGGARVIEVLSPLERTLPLPVTVPPRPLTPRVTPEPHPTLGDSHLEVIPRGGELVAGLDNELIVRLTDSAGAPRKNALLIVRHDALPGKAVRLETDSEGYASLRLRADRLSYALRFELGAATTVVDLIPAGRELLLEVAPRQPGGTKVPVKVTTLRTKGRLACELSDGGVWLWALDLAFDGERERTFELPLPDRPPGTRLDLQCALVPSPGRASASTPIWLEPTNPEAPVRLADLARASTEATPWRAPSLWLSTREAETELAMAGWQAVRTRLFVALAAVLGALLLFGSWLVLRHTASTRRAMNALATELPEAERRALTRTRGWLILAIGLALAVGWVAAVASLLA